VKYRYARLCLILIVSLLLGLPMRESGYSGSILGALTIAAIYTAASAAGSTMPLRRLYIAAVVPSVVISLKIAILGSGDGLALIGTLLFAACFAFAAVEILIRLARQELVTTDTVLGGIAVYLLIGFAFFYLFGAVELMIPGSFLEEGVPLTPSVHARHLLTRHPDLIYFSFVALTTVGFGDIVPALPVARVLTVCEALIGQLYLTTFLAFLIGNYISARTAGLVERATESARRSGPPDERLEPTSRASG
jgi:hypothetical protein